MEDYPKTLAEFERRFATETACIQYMFVLRWPNGFICPRCGAKKAWFTNRGLYKCAVCAYQASVKAGTIFERSRLPLTMWFRAIWWITSQKNGASAKGVQRILGLGSYKTAWTWLHKLRRAMVRPGRDRLACTLEVDETYIGGEKQGKRGRGAAYKTLVLIAVEDKDKEGFGRIRLGRCADASSFSLTKFVQENIEPGSIVRTDGWKGYVRLSSEGYEHVVVKQNASVGDDMLPLAHRIASLLKRWLIGTHQGAVSKKHLDYYLDEYTFRFNRRTSKARGLLFYRLLQNAVLIGPAPYHQLK